METLVATVLLIVVFTVASLTVNNLFGNTVTYDTRAVHTHLNALEYRYQNQQLTLPHSETYLNWNIAVSPVMQQQTACVSFEAVNPETKKTITKIVINHVEKP